VSRAPAPLGRRLLSISGRRDVGPYVVLSASDPDGPVPAAGQFYMLAAAARWGGGADERPLLPRAFSVLRALNGSLEFMLEEVGPGTSRLAELRAGDGLYVLGPLGHGFTPPGNGGRALLCGGGVGTAPLAILQDELRAGGVRQDALLGFRDAAHAAGAELLDGARVATDDGGSGHHGLVTDLLVAELDTDPGCTVYACGPPPMLEAVRAICEERGAPAQLALESGMACGYGACFGCVVELRSGDYVRLCVDGPVLGGELLASCLAPGHGTPS
jgi:NAD(P)H-flavin reductase